MARVRLEFPNEIFGFSTTVQVRFDDINIGHHLGNERLVALLGEARSRFLASLGLSDTGGDGVPGTLVADLVVTFRAEARLRDELRIDVGVAEPSRYGGDLVYRVVRVADDVLVAVAKTALVFYDYDQKRLASAPAVFHVRPE